MEKNISYSQFQSVKRVAQACDPLKVKRDKIKEKIELLTNEYNDLDAQISSLEAGIKQIVGFRVEELVKKVIEPGIDANGKPKKTTKYLPTDIISYNENLKQYTISLPDECACPTQETFKDSPEEEEISSNEELQKQSIAKIF